MPDAQPWIAKGYYEAWANADDGWDLFASNDVVVIENSWAFSNGKVDGQNPAGDGNRTPRSRHVMQSHESPPFSQPNGGTGARRKSSDGYGRLSKKATRGLRTVAELFS